MLITTGIVAREIINGLWAIMALYLTGIFALYLSTEVRAEGWFHNKVNQAALGIVFLCAGNALYHGWIWFMLAQSRLDLLDGMFLNVYSPLVVSALLAYAGAYLSIRMFSEKPRRTRALVCVLFLVISFISWTVYL